MLYDWLKALHVIAVIAWMAGMLYLPRLFVYHTTAKNAETDATFQIMERRLLKIIINPAMVASWLFGGWMVLENMALLDQRWFQIKLVLLLGMQTLHMFFARWQRDFAEGKNRHSEKFYRFINEMPTILFMGIVILVIVKPLF